MQQTDGPARQEARSILVRAGVGIAVALALGIGASLALDTPDSTPANRTDNQPVRGASAGTEAGPAVDQLPRGARRQTFPIDEVDARDLIDALGAPWRGGLIDDARADGYSGGYSRMIRLPNGSVTIHTLADGRVWNLQLRSGMGDRCGRARDIAPHITRIYATLQPGKQVSGDALVALVAGLDAPGARQITVAGVRLSTLGDCIRSLDVRTIPDDELH